MKEGQFFVGSLQFRSTFFNPSFEFIVGFL